jgi:cytochrome oxidase assembly protein ShyY1
MPKRILTTVFVASAVVIMMTLGFWQLDRHAQKSDINEKISGRQTEKSLGEIELQKLLTENLATVGEAYEYRRVTLSGTYQQDDSILVRNRTFNGIPGFWLLTPMKLDNGLFVVINRGWLPISAEGYVDSEIAIFNITGVLRETETAKGLQKADTGQGPLESLGRVDLDRYSVQLGYEIFPFYIQLFDQSPIQKDGFPQVIDRPQFSEGQHLNYAVQWFIFATIATVGYPLVLWRYSKGRNTKKRRESDIPIDYL